MRAVAQSRVWRSKVRSGVCGRVKRAMQTGQPWLGLRRGACLSACFRKRFLLIRHLPRGNSLNLGRKSGALLPCHSHRLPICRAPHLKVKFEVTYPPKKTMLDSDSETRFWRARWAPTYGRLVEDLVATLHETNACGHTHIMAN